MYVTHVVGLAAMQGDAGVNLSHADIQPTRAGDSSATSLVGSSSDDERPQRPAKRMRGDSREVHVLLTDGRFQSMGVYQLHT